MFQHLLVPLDGTKLAETVLPAVADLARRAGSRVTLLHVVEQDAPREVHGEPHLSTAAEADGYLSAVAGSPTFRELEVRWHVHEASIRDVPVSLVRQVDELAPDLIVLCVHDAHRARDFWSGNIAQQVVERGKTPVLLLRADAPGPALGRILVPLDGSPAHERGLAPAEALATMAGARLDLLTVVPNPEHLTGRFAVAGNLLPGSTRARLEIAEEDAAAYLGEQIARLRATGLEASGTVVRGDPTEQIREFVAEHAIDCVALGTHGRTGAGAFFEGSLAQRLVRGTRAAFLLTPVG
jgi:nucleotide-binding universal stress UspA family protein